MRVVLVVRLPLPVRAVGMIDGRCGSIDAEVLKDEATTPANAPKNYMTDLGQMVDEAVAYSTKEQETEQATALDATHT